MDLRRWGTPLNVFLEVGDDNVGLCALGGESCTSNFLLAIGCPFTGDRVQVVSSAKVAVKRKFF